MKGQQITGSMLNFINEVRKTYDKCLTDIQYYEKEFNDLTHALELFKFNASDGYKLAKELQDNRKNRRLAKNNLEQLEPINQLIRSNERFVKELKKTNSDVINITKNQNARSYRVRARTDMQEAFDKANMR